MSCFYCGRPINKAGHVEDWRDRFHLPLPSDDADPIAEAAAPVDTPMEHRKKKAEERRMVLRLIK